MIAWLKRLFRVGNPANDHKRSPHWPAVERAHLRAEPCCQWCRGNNKCQVHHILPFWLFAEKELDPANLITLCMAESKCHLKIGHLGNWHKYDVHVRLKCLLHKMDMEKQK